MKLSILLSILLSTFATTSPDLCDDVYLDASGNPVTDLVGQTLSRYCEWTGPDAPVWDANVCCTIDHDPRVRGELVGSYCAPPPVVLAIPRVGGRLKLAVTDLLAHVENHRIDVDAHADVLTPTRTATPAEPDLVLPPRGSACRTTPRGRASCVGDSNCSRPHELSSGQRRRRSSR